MLGEILDQVHALVSDERGGEVASYIPALARAAPEDFGLAIVTTGGDVYTSGESETEFTIQSVSKPFTLALALDRCGLESTYQRVGTEPSGDAFNSVVLDPQTNVPFNPMINSGAIAGGGVRASRVRVLQPWLIAAQRLPLGAREGRRVRERHARRPAARSTKTAFRDQPSAARLRSSWGP
jgi:glutaminase